MDTSSCKLYAIQQKFLYVHLLAWRVNKLSHNFCSTFKLFITVFAEALLYSPLWFRSRNESLSFEQDDNWLCSVYIVQYAFCLVEICSTKKLLFNWIMVSQYFGKVGFGKLTICSILLFQLGFVGPACHPSDPTAQSPQGMVWRLALLYNIHKRCDK